MTHYLNNIIKVLLICLLCSVNAEAQNPRGNRNEELREQTQQCIDRIYNYLNGCTPYVMTDQEGNPVGNIKKYDPSLRFAKGDFGICTYEWGVTYSGMLKLSAVLSDTKYEDYVFKRLTALGEVYPAVRSLCESDKEAKRVSLMFLHEPRFLDDCGAMCAAMTKAILKDAKRGKSFRALHDNWFDFVMNKEYRMEDRILARHRPAKNSVWLDDMYMGIPPIAYRGALAAKESDQALAEQCYLEALAQIQLFRKYLWVPDKNIFRHGWIEGMSEHPNYHWARANGWAVLTMSDVLDIVPKETEGWQQLLEQYKEFLKALASYQAPNGLWHQLIDQTETYLETSASAMYVYGIAHGINQGWLDRTAYIDVAKAGWRGLMTQVNQRGQVENTCVGTGLGWTNTFYANRPVNVYAAHGYGPVLLAAAEMMQLLNEQ